MSNLTFCTPLVPTTPAPLSARTWREHRDLAGFAVRTGAVSVELSNHNSINPMGATPVDSFTAGRRVYAAKQAAPPRGRPR